MEIRKPITLSGVVKHYHWGKPARDSLVAKIAQLSCEGKEPTAELWFGVHPNGVATVAENGQSLSEFLIGMSIESDKNFSLSFLLKVLSVDKVLSLQVHPTTEQAMILHAKDPHNYPDANAKPELAFAISQVLLFYGFAQRNEIVERVSRFGELGKKIIQNLSSNADLRDVIFELIACPDGKKLLASAEAAIRRNSQLCDFDKVYLKCFEQCEKGDAGLLLIPFLVFLKLNPGEAVYIRPNLPHAYISGDLVECLSNSDNVIRLGLTPKYCDIEAAMKILDFSSSDDLILGQRDSEGWINFKTPAREFLLRIAKGRMENLPLRNHVMEPSMLFALDAQGYLRLSGCEKFTLDVNGAYLLPPLMPSATLNLHKGLCFYVSNNSLEFSGDLL